MAGQDPQKLVIIATHAEENPDKATLPFVMGNTALAMDMDSTVILQSTGVYLAYRGYAEHVHAAGFPPLTELLATYLEAGGKLMVCSPCLEARKITPEELIEPAVIIAGATLIGEIASATNVVTY
ncbi:MAG: DsrE family protein [Desulfarculus sp.]|nr:DsrE family protein [Desulfarculus sp.]